MFNVGLILNRVSNILPQIRPAAICVFHVTAEDMVHKKLTKHLQDLTVEKYKNKYKNDFKTVDVPWNAVKPIVN